MSARRAALAVWDFVVGDDPRLAFAAVVAIGLTALVCALGVSAWWLAPIVALTSLAFSLRGARTVISPCDRSASDLSTSTPSTSSASRKVEDTDTR